MSPVRGSPRKAWPRTTSAYRSNRTLPRLNHPQKNLRTSDFLNFLRLPVLHIEGVRDNSRSRFQVAPQLGPKLHVDARQEIKRHHGGFLDIGIEQVTLPELDQ